MRLQLVLLYTYSISSRTPNIKVSSPIEDYRRDNFFLSPRPWNTGERMLGRHYNKPNRGGDSSALLLHHLVKKKAPSVVVIAPELDGWRTDYDAQGILFMDC